MSKGTKHALSRELKINSEIAGTFPKLADGNSETSGYDIVKYSISTNPLIQRGLLFQRRSNGENLGVISAHEEGEPFNSASYEHQRDLAVRYARQEGVPFGEVDLDHAHKVLKERKTEYFFEIPSLSWRQKR